MHLPLALMRSYIDAIGMLDAKEKLGDITVSALGFGNLKRVDSARLMAKLRRVASDGDRDQPIKKADPSSLSAIGIGFETTKKEQ